jgi:hypothetical protein
VRIGVDVVGAFTDLVTRLTFRGLCYGPTARPNGCENPPPIVTRHDDD